METKAFVSPRRYGCSHYSTDKYYYEDKKGNSICRNCYLRLVKQGFDKKWLSPLTKAINEVIEEEEYPIEVTKKGYDIIQKRNS